MFLQKKMKSSRSETSFCGQPSATQSEPRRNRILSIYSWLMILLGSVLVISVWWCGWQQVIADHDRTMWEASKETMNLAGALEEDVQRIFANVDKELLNLQKICEQEGSSSLVLATYFQAVIKDPAYAQVAAYDEKGTRIAVSFQTTLSENDLAFDAFQNHKSKATQGLVIGRRVQSKSNGESVIPLSRRINKPDGSFGGIVYIALRVNTFAAFFQQVDLGQQQLLSIDSLDGSNLAGKAGDPSDSELQGSPGSISAISTVGGVTRIVRSRVLAGYPIVVSVGKELSMAMESYEIRKYGNILSALLTSLFIVALCILLISRHEKTEKLTAVIQLERDRLLSLINSIYAEVWFLDTNKQLTLANAAATNAFGLNSLVANYEDVVANYEVLHLDGSPRLPSESALLRGIQGEVVRSHHEIARTFPNRELRHREVNATPVVDPKGKIIGAVAVVNDITDRVLMEEEIRRHRDNLQSLVEVQVRHIQQMNTELITIFESISDPFYVFDDEWKFTYANTVAVNLSSRGLNKNHIGKNVWEEFPDLVGSEFYEKCHEARAENQPVHTIVKSIGSDKLFDTRFYPYANGLLVYLKDITDEKKYEAELTRLDRLNIIGEMAASIAHEVRNPMTTVRGYLQYFGKKACFNDYQEQLGLMIEELDRANMIITDFLSLAHNKAVEIRKTDLNKVIRSLFPLLESDALLRGNEIELELGDIPEVLADDKEIRQCILNLVRNGLDASIKGGKVTIGTSKIENRVRLTVKDRGTGIPPNIEEKLGTPFLTTKEEGTGLGLAVCYRIAQRHQAILTVETGGQGTTVHFTFS